MSAVQGLRIGPLTLRIEGPTLHPSLDGYQAPAARYGRRVVVTASESLPPETDPATAKVGFALTTAADHDHVTLWGDTARHTPWHAALCEIVARDAPTHGCLLVHAGAIRVAGGVALLIAPPGVGKTTAVRSAGRRAFASNAVLLDLSRGSPTVSAMPFAREPAPELDSPGSLPLVALAFVERSPDATVEWIAPSLATIRLMPHITRPRGGDPHARVRTDLALSMGGKARALTLGLPLGTGYLAALDAALHSMTNPR